MEMIIIAALIITGLILIVAEIVFIPGITVVGVLGFGLIVTGVFITFRLFGPDAGWATAGGSGVASAVVLYFSFKSKVWNRFSLRSAITSTVNEGNTDLLSPGQEGIALSALRPVGKGEWNQKIYEVKTQGEYVGQGTKIRIIKISNNQITVEPTP